MIKSKKDYLYFLAQDALALCRFEKHPKLFGDEVWKFERTMRKLEYCKTFSKFKKIVFSPYIFLLRIKYHSLSLKCGFEIPIGVFEQGLAIIHKGSVTISMYSKIGKNCRIVSNVTVGVKGIRSEAKKAPQIGDNCFLGTGARVIGDIEIANNICIGANAVVLKSITESNTTWGGIPAKKIGENGSRKFLSDYLFNLEENIENAE